VRPSADGYDSECFRNQWVASLGDLRRELGFKIIGHVLTPEHFHTLVWPRALVILIRFRSDLGGLLTAKRFAALGQPFPHVDAGPHWQDWGREKCGDGCSGALWLTCKPPQVTVP
jgi:hypothetical protein